jgi:hypothetical protein
MSDLISRKVVTGEKFREFRENPKNRSACLDRCFKHLCRAALKSWTGREADNFCPLNRGLKAKYCL